MIHKIHQTPEQQQAINSENSFEELKKHGDKLDNVQGAIEKMSESIKDKTIETLGFTGIIQHLKGTNSEAVIRKLEEIKSAMLITNKLLKDIKQKDIIFPEIPKTDFTETNKLLTEIIEKKQEEVTVTLTLI